MVTPVSIENTALGVHTSPRRLTDWSISMTIGVVDDDAIAKSPEQGGWKSFQFEGSDETPDWPVLQMLAKYGVVYTRALDDELVLTVTAYVVSGVSPSKVTLLMPVTVSMDFTPDDVARTITKSSFGMVELQDTRTSTGDSGIARTLDIVAGPLACGIDETTVITAVIYKG